MSSNSDSNSDDPEYVLRQKIYDKYNIILPNDMTRSELEDWYYKENLKPKIIPEDKLNPKFSNPISILEEEQMKTPLIGKSIKHNFSDDVYLDAPLPLEGNLETLQAIITDLKLNLDKLNKEAVFQQFRPRIRSLKLKTESEFADLKTPIMNSRFVIEDESAPTKYTADQLKNMKLNELKEIAKNNGIKAPRTKAELLDTLINALTNLRSAPLIEKNKDIFDTRFSLGRDDKLPNSPVLPNNSREANKMSLGDVKVEIPKYSTSLSPLSLPNPSVVDSEQITMSSKLNDYRDIDLSRLSAERSTSNSNSYSISELRSIAKRIGLRATGEKKTLVNEIREKLEKLNYSDT